ncbi:MAG: HprK-related kinase B [Oceanospirillales bacterium]|nr:HprK-related kinase B [Oceanospirillales bacterium]
MINETAHTLADALVAGHPLVADILVLTLDGMSISVRSNSPALIARLGDYFAHVVADPKQQTDIEVVAIERDAPNLDLPYVDWRREAGKKGRKDACFDLPGARVIHKVRTGMTFLQSDKLRIAAGPCLANDNQVINFINNQYMNALQQRGWLNCHAAALRYRGRALAMAGFSGGGKSTLMLHMMENPDTAFISNDRLFVQAQHGKIMAAGIPKLPRINPGTIINNTRLSPLISEREQAELSALPAPELWDLEQKYDADITQLYGEGRIEAGHCPLAGFMVLNWTREKGHPLKVEQVDLAERRDLLAAIMKSPGPFYQNADGVFLADSGDFDESAYLNVLQHVPVYEASGSVDFEALSRRYFERADSHHV